jgi:Xaa-Pro aminopeptidase
MGNVGRRDFLKKTGAGLGAAGVGVMGATACVPDQDAMSRAASGGSFELLRAEQDERKAELPEPADVQRLPESWYRETAASLKQEARQRGVTTGIVLTNRWNIIYATGLHHSTTERRFAAFLPMDEDTVIWLYPYLDDALVSTWWSDGERSDYFFDHHHAEGGFPNRGEVVQGDTVNPHRWWGEKLAELGYGDGVIGIDSGGMAEIGILPGQEDAERLDMFGDIEVPEPGRPEGGAFGTMASALPDAQFVDVYDILIRNRVVKDELELRLVQRAEDYWSEIPAFARNSILERGLGVVDWEVANAAQAWGMHRIMEDIEQAGEPHDAVDISVGVSCRSGPVTAYPHPNQQYWSPVEEGDALQISGVVRIGGYGGEQYRSFLVAPWTDWQEHVWEVHTRSYYIQAEEAYAGNTCSNVA